MSNGYIRVVRIVLRRTCSESYLVTDNCRASMLYADGRVILMEEDGDLSLVRLTPTTLERLATTSLFNSRAWTVPTLVGAILYARDRERVVAVDLGRQ